MPPWPAGARRSSILGLIVPPAVAIALMVVVGVSNAVIDVAGFTLLQRAIPNAARVAVLGLLISGAGATWRSAGSSRRS